MPFAKKNVYLKYPELKNKKVILYIPTFRDDDNYEIDNLISDINNNDYNYETNDLLSCNIIDGDNNVISLDALNEITILTPPRTLILDVYIDNEYFEKII